MPGSDKRSPARCGRGRGRAEDFDSGLQHRVDVTVGGAAQAAGGAAMNARIRLPWQAKGRPSAASKATYDAALDAFCAAIQQIRSTLDFAPSARGWCYLLEEHGLFKSDFDAAQKVIAGCRKSGRLPLDVTAEDGARQAENLEDIDDSSDDAAEYAAAIVGNLKCRHLGYEPFSFWDGKPYYVEMLVEKIDLRELFKRICAHYRVPIINGRGWTDLHSRAAMMRRFADRERQGNEPVLLYCGDHDPAGLNISSLLPSNFAELSGAVGWDPGGLIIDRFGLNADFIEQHGLSWVDNLETSNGAHPLDDPRHPDHRKSYVRQYLAEFGARKCEANALVVRPEAGRELCRRAILRYVDAEAPADYQRRLAEPREELRLAIIAELAEGER
jgi:hypothetical protein